MSGRSHNPRLNRRAGGLLIAAAAAAVMVGGCTQDEKLVRYRPFFTGIGEAVHQTAPVSEPLASGLTPKAREGGSPGTGDLQSAETAAAPSDEPNEEGGLVITNRDGSRTLVLKSIRHLMSNVERCLDEGEEALLLEQAVAESAKEHFRREGKDPAEIVKHLQKHRRDLAVMFARMPFAERSPTVISEKSGRNQFRLRLTGQAKQDVKFDSLWVELEGAQWKFVWAS